MQCNSEINENEKYFLLMNILPHSFNFSHPQPTTNVENPYRNPTVEFAAVFSVFLFFSLGKAILENIFHERIFQLLIWGGLGSGRETFSIYRVKRLHNNQLQTMEAGR